MDSRWFLLVLVLIQAHDITSLSPIPVDDVAEEDWASFYRMLRDPAYRLPTTTKPRLYNVTLTPYFENVPSGITPFTFDGQATIYISATVANVSEIVLHCEDLTITKVEVTRNINGEPQPVPISNDSPQCEMPYAFLRVSPTQALQLNQEYTVNVTYRGNLQTDMRGFYRSWYRDSSGNKRWMATTQFQPGHARKAFPCYDEPGFKALFNITINREGDFKPSISNMPIRRTISLGNGRTADSFYTTPLTSSYLVAFIVSHYEKVESSNNTLRPFDIYARDNVGVTGQWSLEVGEKLLAYMEGHTDYEYYSMAPFLNMKQAAIPDFSAGAMENWGLLTYREANILYHPENSNHFYKQRVANIVAHEIAHMWFGNLVTCAWWDNLWLNEGFARYYQYFLTGPVLPDLGYETRFIVEQVHTAMFSDSLDSAHALTNPSVNDPAAVSSHFSTITYARGAAVLRMTQQLLGENTYLTGLRNYLKDRAFDVSEPRHLFSALDTVAAADSALATYGGVTIESYLKSWSEQAGHPLLTVVVNHETGLMQVTQARWERNTGVSSVPTLYQIPITWTRGGAPNFINLKPSQVLTQTTTTINRGSTGYEWVIFNKQETGFYRVNYDDTTWDLITAALKSNERRVIHDLNRAQIVDDVFALARAGVMSYTKAMDILSFLEFEEQYAPWVAAISGFNWLLRRLAHDPQTLQSFQQEIIKLSSAVTARLGFAEVPGEPFMDGLLRMYVLDFLCNVGHEQCVAQAVTNFRNLRNGIFLPANMRPWVYCAGLRAGTPEDFRFLWSRFESEDLANEIVVLLEKLGCTKDAASLNVLLNSVVEDNELVRPQDYNVALNSAVSGNDENVQIVFEWLKRNIPQTTSALGSVSTPLNYIAGRLLSEAEIVEFETWLNANQNQIGAASYAAGMSGARAARDNLAWSARRLPEIQEYLEYGYTPPPSPSPPPTDAPPVETTPDMTPPQPDAASITTLSAITLALTVAINFVV